jgi:pyruvate/2-oxoglutarate dehydrogenase complex dihydrolipoamide acyltransferase (E2) component
MTKNEMQPLVTRTLRAAVKIGDDYYTIEETISLPPTANDDQIMEAVDAGLRMYTAQREAVEAQVRNLREQVVSQPLPVQLREPDAPASDKQRAYMDFLARELNIDGDQLSAIASEHNMDVQTLTKREASELIDVLKKRQEAGNADGAEEDSNEEAPAAAPAPQAKPAQPALPMGDRITQRQIRALDRLAEERGVDLDAEVQERFGERPVDQLTTDEAGRLLGELQQRPRLLRPTRRAA